MAKPQKLPIDDLIMSAEKSARLCWKGYDALIAEKDHGGGWPERARAAFLRCATYDEKLQRLKWLRAKSRRL
jgi:hypothetical protein